MLSRELADVRRLLEKTAAHTTYAGADNGSQPDVDVARGLGAGNDRAHRKMRRWANSPVFGMLLMAKIRKLVTTVVS